MQGANRHPPCIHIGTSALTISPPPLDPTPAQKRRTGAGSGHRNISTVRNSTAKTAGSDSSGAANTYRSWYFVQLPERTVKYKVTLEF